MIKSCSTSAKYNDYEFHDQNRRDVWVVRSRVGKVVKFLYATFLCLSVPPPLFVYYHLARGLDSIYVVGISIVLCN